MFLEFEQYNTLLLLRIQSSGTRLQGFGGLAEARKARVGRFYWKQEAQGGHCISQGSMKQ